VEKETLTQGTTTFNWGLRKVVQGKKEATPDFERNWELPVGGGSARREQRADISNGKVITMLETSQECVGQKKKEGPPAMGE